jgi:hypothetical protein
MPAAGTALLALIALQASSVSVSPESSTQGPPPSVSPRPSTDQVPPVSLRRIRQALETQTQRLKPDATEPTKPTFRTEIRGRKIESVLDGLDFKAGPVPLGGLYAFEQAQLLGNPWAGRPIIAVNILPIVQAAHRAISNARHGRAERAAHEEAQRAVIELCRTQTNCSFR